MFQNLTKTILSCAITTIITGRIASETRGGPNFMFCPRAQCELVTPLMHRISKQLNIDDLMASRIMLDMA